MNEKSRDPAFVSSLISVGVLFGAAIGYCLWSVEGVAEVPILAGSSALGGLAGLAVGWQVRVAPYASLRLIVEAIGFLFSLCGLAFAAYLLTEDHLTVVPFSTTLFVVVLWLRLLPKGRRAVPAGIGCAALATVGIVEGIALEMWPMIAVGAVCGIGSIVSFVAARNQKKAKAEGSTEAAA